MMRSSLEHLPTSKQRELAHIVRVLLEEFDEQIKLGTQPWKRRGRILKVILYGSYARGDWVDDAKGGYKSDYDILIVVTSARSAARCLGEYGSSIPLVRKRARPAFRGERQARER